MGHALLLKLFNFILTACVIAHARNHVSFDDYHVTPVRFCELHHFVYVLFAEASERDKLFYEMR